MFLNLLNIQVTDEEPTFFGDHDVCSMDTPKVASRVKHGRINCKATFHLWFTCFSG